MFCESELCIESPMGYSLLLINRVHEIQQVLPRTYLHVFLSGQGNGHGSWVLPRGVSNARAGWRCQEREQGQ